MELDHVFICVAPGAPEGDVLIDFGLREGSPNRHPGQGTACRRFFFQNAYLELAYIRDVAELRNERTRPTRLYERLSSASPAVSPMGIGFRPASGGSSEVPFPSRPYRPPYLPKEHRIAIGEAPLSEPMWFYISPGVRPDRLPDHDRPPMDHRAGFKEISRLAITIPDHENLSKPAVEAARTGVIEIVPGKEHLLRIGFDGERTGRVTDFRPHLQVIFSW